jgi:hypothetical protein
MRKNLSVKFIEKPPATGRRIEYTDTNCRGLAFVLQPSGHRSTW